MAIVKRGRPNLGYTIYRRAAGTAYYMRFTLEGHPQFRFGLGAKDEDEAKQLAEEKYLGTEISAKHGLLVDNASNDITQIEPLPDGLKTDFVLADKGYNRDRAMQAIAAKGADLWYRAAQRLHLGANSMQISTKLEMLSSGSPAKSNTSQE